MDFYFSPGGIGLSLAALATFIFGIYCAVLANQFDDARWQQVGQPKMLFVIGCPVGGFCCWPIGLGLSLWFFLGLKPKLEGTV